MSHPNHQPLYDSELRLSFQCERGMPGVCEKKVWWGSLRLLDSQPWRCWTATTGFKKCCWASVMLLGPGPIVINKVKRGPYKWPKINGLLFFLDLYKWSYKPNFNWYRGPSCVILLCFFERSGEDLLIQGFVVCMSLVKDGKFVHY